MPPASESELLFNSDSRNYSERWIYSAYDHRLNIEWRPLMYGELVIRVDEFTGSLKRLPLVAATISCCMGCKPFYHAVWQFCTGKTPFLSRKINDLCYEPNDTRGLHHQVR